MPLPFPRHTTLKHSCMPYTRKTYAARRPQERACPPCEPGARVARPRRTGRGTPRSRRCAPRGAPPPDSRTRCAPMSARARSRASRSKYAAAARGYAPRSGLRGGRRSRSATSRSASLKRTRSSASFDSSSTFCFVRTSIFPRRLGEALRERRAEGVGDPVLLDRAQVPPRLLGRLRAASPRRLRTLESASFFSTISARSSTRPSSFAGTSVARRSSGRREGS